MNITFEERQLMSLYNTGTRTGLIAALEEMRGYLAAPFHPQRGSRAFPPAPRSSPCGCRCCRGS